jgi:uncharacterized DUF497 family protein
MAIKVSDKVAEKLARKHNVKFEEVVQCFANKDVAAKYLRDPRAQHETNPPTQWFISETDYGRKLKVIFMRSGTEVTIKSAFEPNAEELRIYNKFGRGN